MKINEIEFYLPTEESVLVECAATVYIVYNKDDYFIFIDKSFNSAERYIELPDGARSNDILEKRGEGGQ